MNKRQCVRGSHRKAGPMSKRCQMLLRIDVPLLSREVGLRLLSNAANGQNTFFSDFLCLAESEV